MQQKISLRLLPSEANNDTFIKQRLARENGIREDAITGYHILKKSIDARTRPVWINLQALVFIREPFQQRILINFEYKNVAGSPQQVVIIGAGPAGLFAALYLLQKGIKPIILERGKDVKSRRRDLASLNKSGILNPESNYCFGEGGAGTYSDGKLFTRSNKRGNIQRILSTLVRFGADEKILYESHPHIGTNKLPQLILAIRNQILDCGGEIYFEQKVVDLLLDGNKIKALKTAENNLFKGDAYILATGHSARDIFELLHSKNILIEAKPFALGVRVEHPQSLIDSIQYHCRTKDIHLPAASYNLVHQVNDKGVFSFCMCPGGNIAPASTALGELVVNGWSPSKRNNPFANSGMVVQVEQKNIFEYFKNKRTKNNFEPGIHPLSMMYFQKEIEIKAYGAGGGKFVAPAQRLVDFTEKKLSTALPACSYLPGVNSSLLHEVLPDFISYPLAKGLQEFGKKMKGYFTNEAILVATESRTSSPVRIPRDSGLLSHIQIKNLFPCGEGAGYAGGIMSAAMDGENVAEKIYENLKDL